MLGVDEAMMFQNLPTISIVMAVYNAEHRLRACLDAIMTQDYPFDHLEFVIVDDASTDGTVSILREYGIQPLVSGHRFCEISRLIGIRQAKHDLVLFLDDDNYLPDRDFLRRLVQPFMEQPDLVAAFPAWFHYDRSEPAANRYCTLFGINDPYQFYLNSREHLMPIEKTWNLGGDMQEYENYFLIDFARDRPRLTLGAIGFLAWRDLLLKVVRDPYFFHIEACYDLIDQGHTRFAAVKTDIIHLHCRSTRDFCRKLKRNIDNYLAYESCRDPDKVWATADLRKLVRTTLMFIVGLRPLIDSIQGYRQLRDPAWLLNPLFCWATVAIYGWAVGRARLQSLFGRNSKGVIEIPG